MQPTQPVTPAPAGAPLGPPPAPAVVLFDLRGNASVAAAPAEDDDLYDFLSALTGYSQLEPWTFILSRKDTTLMAALYLNEVGAYEDSVNPAISEALGVEVRGKAVLVCMEEYEDDDGEGAWSKVLSVEALLRKLAERGEPLPEAAGKRLEGRVGDVMHELRRMLVFRRRAPAYAPLQ